MQALWLPGPERWETSTTVPLDSYMQLQGTSILRLASAGALPNPLFGELPVLRDSGREAGSNSPLYPPVSKMLLTQILLLAAPGALCLSGKQKINPKNQTLITPGGEG